MKESIWQFLTMYLIRHFFAKANYSMAIFYLTTCEQKKCIENTNGNN
jgi:hypothetical protein